mmetsp:Transcript_50461/g.100739  ORF Transcript_50461/g.100739 Transcript_50461/m.100739 type:complete len:120 (+) Transcript_50461:486-845(+)
MLGKGRTTFTWCKNWLREASCSSTSFRKDISWRRKLPPSRNKSLRALPTCTVMTFAIGEAAFRAGFAGRTDLLFPHRDLKPQNLLMASVESSAIKIADFGLSSLRSGNSDDSMMTICGL